MTTTCPACSCKRYRVADPLVPERLRDAVVSCARCGALFTRRAIYLGDSYALVRPTFTRDRSADARARHFDFETLGSDGLGRRHGWFDPQTRCLTQTG